MDTQDDNKGTKKTFTEEIEVAGDKLIERIREIIKDGNVRQLRNVLRAMIGLSDDGVLRADDLPEEVLAGNIDGSGIVTKRPSSPLDIAERDAILRELEAAHWNVTRVASKLNLSRNTLYRKMKRYSIKPPR